MGDVLIRLDGQDGQDMIKSSTCLKCWEIRNINGWYHLECCGSMEEPLGNWDEGKRNRAWDILSALSSFSSSSFTTLSLRSVKEQRVWNNSILWEESDIEKNQAQVNEISSKMEIWGWQFIATRKTRSYPPQSYSSSGTRHLLQTEQTNIQTNNKTCNVNTVNIFNVNSDVHPIWCISVIFSLLTVDPEYKVEWVLSGTGSPPVKFAHKAEVCKCYSFGKHINFNVTKHKNTYQSFTS